MKKGASYSLAPWQCLTHTAGLIKLLQLPEANVKNGARIAILLKVL